MNPIQNKTKTYLSIALSIACMISNANAQSTGTHGGDPNELVGFLGKSGTYLDSWYSVKQDLINGIELNKHLELDLGSANNDYFKLEVLKTLRTATVQWDNLPIEINGVSRPCENFTDQKGVKRIHCNQANYASVMKNYADLNDGSSLQYKMIAHEYFALAGFEPNTYGVSDYWISNQISSQLNQITVKKWAVKESYYSETQDISEILQYSGKLNQIQGDQVFDADIHSIYKTAKSTAAKRFYEVTFTRRSGGCSYNLATISVTTKSQKEIEELHKQYNSLSREEQFQIAIGNHPNRYHQTLVLKIEHLSLCN